MVKVVITDKDKVAPIEIASTTCYGLRSKGTADEAAWIHVTSAGARALIKELEEAVLIVEHRAAVAEGARRAAKEAHDKVYRDAGLEPPPW